MTTSVTQNKLAPLVATESHDDVAEDVDDVTRPLDKNDVDWSDESENLFHCHETQKHDLKKIKKSNFKNLTKVVVSSNVFPKILLSVKHFLRPI